MFDLVGMLDGADEADRALVRAVVAHCMPAAEAVASLIELGRPEHVEPPSDGPGAPDGVT